MSHYKFHTMLLFETKCYCSATCYLKSKLCSKLTTLNIAPKWFKENTGGGGDGHDTHV